MAEAERAAVEREAEREAKEAAEARAREEAYALYAWCRECDQLVDAAGEETSRTREEAARALDGVG